MVSFSSTVYDFVMGQNFLPDTVNQTLLFPPPLHDWLPDGHLARFLVDVVSALDLDAIYASYREKDGRGQAAYAPEMMVRLLLYGYANGVSSSRKIETRTYEDVAFRYLSGDQHPAPATLAAQIAVDSASQVIVAAEITQETNDEMQLLPMIAQIVTNLEKRYERQTPRRQDLFEGRIC